MEKLCTNVRAQYPSVALRAELQELRAENTTLLCVNESLRANASLQRAKTCAAAQSPRERARNALYVLVEISELELNAGDNDEIHELEVRLRVADSQAPLEHGISGCRARVRDAFAAMWVMRRLRERMRLHRRGSEYDPHHMRKNCETWTPVNTTWAAKSASMEYTALSLIREFAPQESQSVDAIDRELIDLDICYIARGMSPEQHLSRMISEESSLRFANEYLESVLRECGICRVDATNWLPDALNAQLVSLGIE